MKILLRASSLYFLLVFSAGFLLGAARVLLVVGLVGERNAELIEMPLMAVVCAFAAKYLVAKYSSHLSPTSAFLLGVISLLMLLAVEFSVVLTLRGLSVSEYFSSRDPISSAAYLACLAWFALAPLVFYRVVKKRHRAS